MLLKSNLTRREAGSGFFFFFLPRLRFSPPLCRGRVLVLLPLRVRVLFLWLSNGGQETVLLPYPLSVGLLLNYRALFTFLADYYVRVNASSIQYLS